MHTTDKAEMNDLECVPFKFPSHQTNTKIIIVLVASIICSVLVFLIIYEFRKYRHLCSSNTSQQSSTNAECVYAEVNEVNLNAIEDEETIWSTVKSNDGKT